MRVGDASAFPLSAPPRRAARPRLAAAHDTCAAVAHLSARATWSSDACRGSLTFHPDDPVALGEQPSARREPVPGPPVAKRCSAASAGQRAPGLEARRAPRRAHAARDTSRRASPAGTDRGTSASTSVTPSSSTRRPPSPSAPRARGGSPRSDRAPRRAAPRPRPPSVPRASIAAAHSPVAVAAAAQRRARARWHPRRWRPRPSAWRRAGAHRRGAARRARRAPGSTGRVGERDRLRRPPERPRRARASSVTPGKWSQRHASGLAEHTFARNRARPQAVGSGRGRGSTPMARSDSSDQPASSP